MLSINDKATAVSDTAFHSELIREAFPRNRYGGAKSAIHAAYRYIAPRVAKQFTERRARAIWEGTARRIDAEEATALHKAAVEEAKRERRDLSERLASLDAALAAVDAEFHGPTLEALRHHARIAGQRHVVGRESTPGRSAPAGGAGRLDRPGAGE